MSDPELTPAEEQVRRLLADARHTEPMPDDVAARLDRALADLRDEPAPRRTPSVSDLATARRRRNARTWLVAAAAAVAIGIGINQLDLSVSSNDDSGSASSADQPQAEAGGDASASKPSAEVPDNALTDDLFAGPLLRLSSERFGAQVRRADGVPAAVAGASGPTMSTNSDSSAARELRKACAVPDVAGRTVAVRYDGQRGVLVYRPVKGETQVVDLYLCGSDEPTRSITLPKR